jgi:crotonobetainyl-CoA:carnitine CoA-transferase CaiB-like acyl-CoA transferase
MAESTDHWLEVLDAADVWCAPVLTLEQLVDHDGFAAIAMTQQVTRAPLGAAAPITLTTTRSPLRIDGEPVRSSRPAPRLGEHTAAVRAEFGARPVAE